MMRRRKSLVLITVDCLRADHCGFYGYTRPTTPFLDVLAGDSLIIPNAVVAGAPTYYSFPAILASRMPLALGRDVIGLAPGEPTLASALRDAGYATAGFSAANPYLSSRFGYDQGFDVFKDFLDFCADERQGTSARRPSNVHRAPSEFNRSLNRVAHAIGLGRIYDDLYFEYRLRVAAPAVRSIDNLRKFPSAETMVDQAATWLASVSQAARPFFMWVHLMDPHSPYYPSPAAYREFTGRDASASDARYLNEFWNRSDLETSRFQLKKDSVMELYDAGIRATDDQLARLVDYLKNTGVWDDCAFVLTADHGEEFLDHGGRYHAPVNLGDEITRVPLLMRIPDAQKKQVASSPFSHLHLAPTLLEMLEVPSPTSFRGTSLWSNLDQAKPWDSLGLSECVWGCTNPFRIEPRMAERLISVRDAHYKLVMRIDSAMNEQMFDLETDPGEKLPLPPAAQKEARKRLLQALRMHIQTTSREREETVRLKGRLHDLRVELQTKSG